MSRTSAAASDSRKRLVLRAVRGSASTVILAMILFPNLHGESGLASVSGMSRKTVRKCLYDLEGLGVVLHGDRYRGWVLAPGVRQMVLGEGGGEGYILPIEGYSLPFPSSSSSDKNCNMIDNELMDTETTTTKVGEGYNLPLPAGLEDALDVLVGMGCSPRVATGALAEASAGGCGAQEIARRLDGWRVYCVSERGASIRAPGFLAAKRLVEGVDAPMGREETRAEKAARYVAEVMERRRLDGG